MVLLVRVSPDGCSGCLNRSEVRWSDPNQVSLVWRVYLVRIRPTFWPRKSIFGWPLSIGSLSQFLCVQILYFSYIFPAPKFIWSIHLYPAAMFGCLLVLLYIYFLSSLSLNIFTASFTPVNKLVTFAKQKIRTSVLLSMAAWIADH